MMEKKDTRPVKCPHCENRLPRGEAIKHTNGRYYHEDCYEEATTESRHYKELIDTTCRIFNLKHPTGQILKQFSLYREDPKLRYTNKGMELTLKYYYDLLENKPRKGDGVGIIPIYYDQAKEQYIRQMKLNELANEFKDFEQEEIIVHVDTNKKNKRKGLIDIESI